MKNQQVLKLGLDDVYEWCQKHTGWTCGPSQRNALQYDETVSDGYKNQVLIDYRAGESYNSNLEKLQLEQLRGILEKREGEIAAAKAAKAAKDKAEEREKAAKEAAAARVKAKTSPKKQKAVGIPGIPLLLS